MDTLDNPGRRRLFQGKVSQITHLRLPWSLSETEFTRGCNQCNDCIDVCETQIITRDEQGFPKIDFDKGECTFCQKCVQVCPQPLFTQLAQRTVKPIDAQPRQHLQQQIAPWPIELNIADKCLAKNNIYCQSCRDVCQTGAIKFSTKSAIAIPALDNNDCNQCGACISTCPQSAINFTFQPSNEISNV
jgi:ferredoxin-type protein NapF